MRTELSLVLEGDLSFGDLNLKAGDFHVATPSSSHPPGRTVNGCLVHVIDESRPALSVLAKVDTGFAFNKTRQ